MIDRLILLGPYITIAFTPAGDDLIVKGPKRRISGCMPFSPNNHQ
jgi:hypothetical protein